jgi:hypothetical protein
LLPLLLEKSKSLGYAVFERDDLDYNLNIVGIRKTNSQANSFDDALWVGWKYKGAWKSFQYPITTDPGTYYRLNPINVDGTAILAPGQYRKSHAIGLHRNSYSALVQVGTLKVYRDNNKNALLDHVNLTPASGTGINIHHASNTGTSTVVDKFSAGCQVFSNINHFNEFMSFCTKARELWGNSFTYTLLEL